MSTREHLPMKVKICGITRREDAELAAELGTWALGFVFYEKSQRTTTAQNVRKILMGLRPGIKTVGVFVNAEFETLRETVETSGIGCVQLHGDESVEFCHLIRQSLPQIEIIKALRPRNEADLETIPTFASVCHRVLLDTYSPKAFGGTGETSNWDLAVRAQQFGPIILAGGLGPDNIREAIGRVGPQAVDASSKLEQAPGIKSAEKLREFFRNISLVEMK